MAKEILVLKRLPSSEGKSRVELVFFLPIDPPIVDVDAQLIFPNGESDQIPADFANKVTPQEITDIDAGTLMWYRRPRLITQQLGESQAALLARVQADLWPNLTDPVKGVVAKLRKEYQFFGTRVDGVA